MVLTPIFSGLKEIYPIAPCVFLTKLINAFSSLNDEANVFIFPELNSGNIAYKLLQKLGGLVAVGPILMGLSKPVHVLHPALDVNQIVDMASIAVVDAQQIKSK